MLLVAFFVRVTEKLRMLERAPVLELPQCSSHGRLHPSVWRAQQQLLPLWPLGASPFFVLAAPGALPEGRPTTPERRQAHLQRQHQAYQPASWAHGEARLRRDAPRWPSPPMRPPAPSSEALQLGMRLGLPPPRATRRPPP